MDEILFLIMALIGVLSSFIGSMIGAGGGFLNVPSLIFLGYAGYSSGISLFAIIFNAIFASIFNIRKKLVDFKISLIFIPTAILGSSIGAYLFDLLKSSNINLFKLLFTILLIFVGIRIYLKNKDDQKNNAQESMKDLKIEEITKKIFALGLLGGLFSGILSGLFGIGGGLVTVPYLTLIMGVSIHVAIGTSLFIMAFTSFSGVINHILFGNLPLLAIIFGICLAAGAVIGSSLGARVAYKLVDEKIKKIYGIITVCLAIPLIWLRIFLPSDPIEVFINNWISFFANLFP